MTTTRTKRNKFVRRTIAPDGSIVIYGKRMVCTQNDASCFAGDRPIFGVYFDADGEAEGAMLWGHPDDERQFRWPGRYCDKDGFFKWMSWNPREAQT